MGISKEGWDVARDPLTEESTAETDWEQGGAKLEGLQHEQHEALMLRYFTEQCWGLCLFTVLLKV